MDAINQTLKPIEADTIGFSGFIMMNEMVCTTKMKLRSLRLIYSAILAYTLIHFFPSWFHPGNYVLIKLLKKHLILTYWAEINNYLVKLEARNIY